MLLAIAVLLEIPIVMVGCWLAIARHLTFLPYKVENLCIFAGSIYGVASLAIFKLHVICWGIFAQILMLVAAKPLITYILASQLTERER